jgi:hypothetical protein
MNNEKSQSSQSLNGPIEAENQTEGKPQPDIFDPFAPENLALPQSVLDEAMASQSVNVVQVVRPSDQTFFRTASEEYHYLAALISHQEEKNARYLIHPSFLPQIGGIKYSLEKLFLYVTRQNVIGFWPIKVRRDGRENLWLQTAEGAVEEGQHCWISVTSNMQKGCYDIRKAEGIFPEPDWPHLTQGLTVEQLLAKAFRDRVILHETHPLILKFRGLI